MFIIQTDKGAGNMGKYGETTFVSSYKYHGLLKLCNLQDTSYRWSKGINCFFKFLFHHLKFQTYIGKNMF